MVDSIPREDHIDLKVAPGRTSLTFEAFNTVVTILVQEDDRDACDAMAKALCACRRYERLFSKTLPHSDVSIINEHAGEFVDVSFETYDVLAAALRYCALSEGLFDVTIGPLSRLWDFRRAKVPDASAIRNALPLVDWRQIELREAVDDESDSPRFQARLARAGASVDVGGIAKGWIADALCSILEREGLSSFLLDLGGNVVARGEKEPGVPWAIGVRNPDGPGMVARTELADASAVTSGIYERCFFENGVRYHHIIDPKTGWPAQTDLKSATVVSKKSLDAEGFSTTLLALGSQKADEFARRRPEILAAVLVLEDGTVRVVSGR